MTDYTKPTGTTGTMMIRDTGSIVEFWITSGNDSTFDHELPYGWTYNGITGTGTYDYTANAGWRKLRSFTITTTQTVTFRLFATGTSGFGGPTTFNQVISRATVPAAPSTPVISNVGSTSADVTFTDGSNGGAAIDSRQIGYGTNGTAPTTTISSDGSTTVTGLTPGTTYYFWARTHNVKGYSAWSARATAVTLNVPAAPSTPVLSSIGPTSITVSWTPNGDGGSPITGYQVGYSTSSGTPASGDPATSPHVISGLTPGETYYFWVRAQNAIGYSPWSAFSTADTIAGARLKVDGVWVFAIVYVKDGGVWKIAIPYVRHAGIWKETI